MRARAQGINQPTLCSLVLCPFPRHQSTEQFLAIMQKPLKKQNSHENRQKKYQGATGKEMAGHYEVIDHLDVHQRERLLERGCQQLVRATGPATPAG